MQKPPNHPDDSGAELADAIRALYDAFAGYPLRPRIPGCPHCELESAESLLHSRDLRQLTWNDLGVFPFKAMTTFGEEEDFKHFLPRILELHARDPLGALYDIDITLGKLSYASWNQWPSSEQHAVRHFVAAWIRKLAADANNDSAWIREDLLSALRSMTVAPSDA